MEQLITTKNQAAKVFDELSILYIKLEKCPAQNKGGILADIHTLECNIIDEIGTERFDEVIVSNEFNLLLNINKETFELIDTIIEDDGKAYKIDQKNYKRFEIKKELQKKFFNEELNEQKIGY